MDFLRDFELFLLKFDCTQFNVTYPFVLAKRVCRIAVFLNLAERTRGDTLLPLSVGNVAFVVGLAMDFNSVLCFHITSNLICLTPIKPNFMWIFSSKLKFFYVKKC